MGRKQPKSKVGVGWKGVFKAGEGVGGEQEGMELGSNIYGQPTSWAARRSLWLSNPIGAAFTLPWGRGEAFFPCGSAVAVPKFALDSVQAN